MIPTKNLPFIRRQHGLPVMQTTHYKLEVYKTQYFALLQKEGLKCLEHVNLYQGKTVGCRADARQTNQQNNYEKIILTLFPPLGSPLRLGGRCGSERHFL